LPNIDYGDNTGVVAGACTAPPLPLDDPLP